MREASKEGRSRVLRISAPPEGSFSQALELKVEEAFSYALGDEADTDKLACRNLKKVTSIPLSE